MVSRQTNARQCMRRYLDATVRRENYGIHITGKVAKQFSRTVKIDSRHAVSNMTG